MATVEKIAQLREAARRYDLAGAGLLDNYTDEDLALIYNGAGPDYLPEAVRERFTEYLGMFESALLIHDLRFSRSDGLRRLYNFANEELYLNCLRISETLHPWYSWRRYRLHGRAAIVYEACNSELGWMAWTNAYAKRISGNSAGGTKESI